MSSDEKDKNIESIQKAMGMFIYDEPEETPVPSAPVIKKAEIKPRKNRSAEDDDFIEMKESEPVNLETVKESFKPDLKKNLKKAADKVPAAQVNKLLQNMEKNKEVIFNKNVPVFDKYSEKDKAVLEKKLDQWKVNKEVSEINASVVLNWLNKKKK